MAYTRFHSTWSSWPSTLTIIGKAFLEYIETGLVNAAAVADDALARAVPSGGASGSFLKKNSATDYDDSWAALTATDIPSLTASKISDFTEASQDVIGAMVAAAGGSYNDAGGTITLPGGAAVALTYSATSTWRAPWAQGNGNTGAHVANQMILHPVIVPTTLTLTGLATAVKTAGTASTAEIVVYNDNGSFMPGTLVKATSALSTTSTGTIGETFTGVTLTPGIYWVGTLSHGTTPAAYETAASATNTASPLIWATMPHGTGSLPTINTGNDGQVVTQSGQATPPATFGGAYASNKNNPQVAMWIAMKVNR